MDKVEVVADADIEIIDDDLQLGEENINTEAWIEFFSYYRYYIDEFAMDVLGIYLYPFQRVILRGMARNNSSMFIACRGIGKSWLSGLFFLCSAILYSCIKCGIASGNFRQARNVIVQKIQGEFAKNENIKREIQFPIKTAGDECCVFLKNGSEIRAISVDQRMGGDGARSWRFHQLLIDEARLVKDTIIEEILIPMTKTKRPMAILHNQVEKGKVIFITSAYLKISPLYNRFKYFYEQMMKGDDEYYVCCLPWQVGVQAGIFDEDDILKERDKPTMTLDKFLSEFESVFAGSSAGSYYPFEITMPVRTAQRGELEQPKKTTAKYIISLDVALSDSKNSDNSCVHVIKIQERLNGSYKKSVVFTKVMNGVSLPDQRDYLRELIHLRFPNIVKLVLDTRGSGEALPSLFYESWTYVYPNGEIVEFSPIVKDDDEDAMRLDGAIPIIRCITATNEFNTRFYPYMKSCLQDKSLELLCLSDEVDAEWKDGSMSEELYALHLEADMLCSELSNIKEGMTEHNNVIYDRIIKTKKRDRVTSLMYALSVVYEYEMEAKELVLKNGSDNKYGFQCFYN